MWDRKWSLELTLERPARSVLAFATSAPHALLVEDSLIDDGINSVG